MSGRSIDEVLAALRASADYLSIPIRELSPDAYRGVPSDVRQSVSVDAVYKHFGSWGIARSSAANDSPPLPAIPAGHEVRGVSTLVGPDGEAKAQWVKTRQRERSRSEILAELIESLPETIPTRTGAIRPPSTSLDPDVLAVYPMGDPHLGMHAWAQEAGEDFDLSIAQRLMEDAIDELAAAEPRAETALVINLGDFFHADNQAGVTARSHHALDTDTRWAKVLGVGLAVMTYSVDRALANHKRVRVINEIGNHDDHSAIFLSVALDAYYRNEPRVEIDLSPSLFHWHEWGAVLIGVTHGHTTKHGDLESIMAADQHEAWGRTKHRYWYVGHIHHTRKLEYRGCTVESFRTLAAKDAWHAGKGYRSGRDMNRIAIHREYGEIARSTVSAAYLQSRWASEAA